VYKKILDNPDQYNMTTPKWEDIVKKDEICTPKHLLFEQIRLIYPALPKIIFYIIADERLTIGKADSGELGYYATIITPDC
jgi:hypothetical protein